MIKEETIKTYICDMCGHKIEQDGISGYEIITCNPTWAEDIGDSIETYHICHECLDLFLSLYRKNRLEQLDLKDDNKLKEFKSQFYNSDISDFRNAREIEIRNIWR